MDDSSFFRNLDIFEEMNRIIEAQTFLSKLNAENFENILLFFQNSIFVKSKKLAKSFIRSLLNIIRFRSKNLDLYANLCKNIDFCSEIVGHILIEFLKDADFMTPSHFKFYRSCMSNELILPIDVVKQISIILFFNVEHSRSLKHLIPLFLWFLPELYHFNNDVFNLFKQRLQDADYFLNQIDLLMYDDWSIFNEFAENFYINLHFHTIFNENSASNNNVQREIKDNSIEYCLQEDKIDKFQELTENNDLNSTCQISLFDLLFQPTQSPSYLQFAALNSSISCVKYLLISNVILKNDIQDASLLHFLNESQSFYEKRNSRNKASQEIEVIEIISSSDSESKNDTDNENENKDKESFIFVDDSETSDDEARKQEKEKKKLKPKPTEIIVLSESSSSSNSNNNSDEENNEDSITHSEKKITKDQNDSNQIINLNDIKEKAERLWMPPIHPGILTSSAKADSNDYIIRKSLSVEFISMMKIKTTSQCAVASGNNEIVRLFYDKELPFNDTPQVAISCFYNDLAKWIIEVVLTPEDDQANNFYSNLLYYSIMTGNLEMTKYIIFNMKNDINSLNFIPIHLAIKFHQIDILSFLLNLKMVDINVIDKTNDKSPFFLAVDQKSLSMVELIANNPSFDFDQIICRTLKPIHYVALYGTSKILKYFISLNSVDINDNVIYKIENEQTKNKKHKRKKRTNKPKKSKNFIEDNEFLFFLDGNTKTQKPSTASAQESSASSTASTSTTNIENNEKEYEYYNDYDYDDEKKFNNDFYFNYKTDIYDFNARKIEPETSDLINTPIICSLLLNNLDNFFVLANDQRLDINIKSDLMPLQLCIKNNMIQIFDFLLSNRSKTLLDIDIYDKSGVTPLQYAILRKKKWAIKSLIKAKCDVAKRTKNEGETVCHLASYSNYLGATKLFISASSNSFFDPNVVNSKLQTPLHYAAIYGSTQIVEYLLSIPNIDVNAPDVEGNTPLHYCIQNSQRHILDLLLSNHSIDVNALNKDNETPLIFAFNYKSDDMIKKLLSLNGIINPNCIEKSSGNTPLHMSVMMKSESLIRLLLKLHNRTILSKIDLSDSSEKCNYYLNSFQYEFSGETDVNVQNYKGFTPLHIAAQSQSDILVRVLLTSPNIVLNIVDYELERCPIHWSSASGGKCWFGMKMFNPYMYDLSRFSNTVFSQLISKDPLTGNVQDVNGDSPFHIALNDSSFDGNLLKNTASQVNKNSETEILILSLVNNKGESYLHLAAASGNRIVLDYMLKTHPELVNEKTVDVLIGFFFGIFLFFFF